MPMFYWANAMHVEQSIFHQKIAPLGSSTIATLATETGSGGCYILSHPPYTALGLQKGEDNNELDSSTTSYTQFIIKFALKG